jgi:hypothetical protein
MEDIDFLKEKPDTFVNDSEALGKLVDSLDKVISMAVHLSSRIDILEQRIVYLLSKDTDYVAALDKLLVKKEENEENEQSLGEAKEQTP